ncbi:DUF29 domain-containing protein [Kosakonia sacchari]|uniref:DUF29 domain-containing protein n=1 Tax=Kosakonia sacchari TaxID=1158459 RepID=UPI0015849EDF|nr:DUF29 domain-containing protein [Kosakonia sacchari]
MSSNLYRTDFYGWTVQQAELLRDGKLNDLDIENLIKEVKSIGEVRRIRLEERFEVLFMYLLKWTYQPGKRSSAWWEAIKEHRRRIEKALQNSASLKPFLEEIIGDAYEVSRYIAARETSLPETAFPKLCPWPTVQAIDNEFFL